MNNNVAVVVGGGWKDPGGSIGGATCRELARRGARVAVVDLDATVADATVAFIQDEGGEAEAYVADASKDEECRRVVEAVLERFGQLDTLVNNLGISSDGSGHELDDAAWDRVMAVNVKSIIFMCRHAIPTMTSGGAIVNLSSIAAVRPPGGFVSSPVSKAAIEGLANTAYPVTKAAIEGLTRVLAHNFGRAGIRANCVRPGEVATWRVLKDRDVAEVLARVRRRSVLGTVGDAWDIARAIAFLASDDARWITGQVLTIDGGAELKRVELWDVD